MDRWDEPGGDTLAGRKRDRVARFYRVTRYLAAHPEGVPVDDLARFLRMSRRSVYRDLHALEEELAIPVWSDQGRWGLGKDALLPVLRFTEAEAMAVFLAARLMAKYADTYDPALAAAFQKLGEALPKVLGSHVHRTLDVMARRPSDPEDARRVRALTRAWAERRVVEFTYDTSTYDPRRGTRPARVRPYLIEPSAENHALYLIGLDETRGAVRTFKLERIRGLAITPTVFEAPPDGVIEEALERAWGIIADQGDVEVTLRFAPSVAARVAETTWHPSQATEREADGSLLWRATVSGTIEIRAWILSWGPGVEVVGPPDLRAEVAGLLAVAAGRYR
ncbi:MAG: WYL domain-containing protein [Chloroflexi bacterium]|nr:WYL domain-containing protein [Chloroflexota bacterium]